MFCGLLIRSARLTVRVKPDFIHPNGKHIYTVWIVPYPLCSALSAIHHKENTSEQVTDLSLSFSVYL